MRITHALPENFHMHHNLENQTVLNASAIQFMESVPSGEGRKTKGKEVAPLDFKTPHCDEGRLG